MESFTSDTQCRVHPWNSLCCIVVRSLDDSAPKMDKAILTAWSALIPKSLFFAISYVPSIPAFWKRHFSFANESSLVFHN